MTIATKRSGWRLLAWSSVFALGALLASATAGAQSQHPLSGNMRLQKGNGPPIPLSPNAHSPNGLILPVDGAVVSVTGGGNLTLQPSRFTAMGTPKNQPVFFANPQVFQINTAIQVVFPKPGSTVVFSPSGRTGADVVSFCPGQVVTAVGNPACGDPRVGYAVGVNGLLRYTRTASQLGGVGRAFLAGTENRAIRPFPIGNGAPCTAGPGGANDPACLAMFALVTPVQSPGQGAAFGVAVATSHAAPTPGRFYVTLGASGTILGIGPTGLGPGLPSGETSYGGPWTAGTLTVSVVPFPGAASTSVFVLSGSNDRDAKGQGSVSLVSGSVSERSLFGPSANRGWLNLEIQPFEGVPALTPPSFVALIGLVALAGLRLLRRPSARRPPHDRRDGGGEEGNA